MNAVLEQLSKVGLVPVIVLDDAAKAVPLCKALSDGGIPVAEVTFRTACAAEAIANIAKELPEVLVGAGTVISVDQVKAAVKAGAKFIVTPGFDPEVVGYCIENDIPITPGCSTASNVSVAAKMGLECVKFFPAEAAGGLKVLKALSGPFPKMKFIPTGGISPANLSDYVAFKKNLAVGGSWMVPGDMVKNCDWDGIKALASEAVLTMLAPSLVHIGINCADDGEAKKNADAFAAIVGKQPAEGGKSFFTGTEFELMKFMGMGKNGHIAVGVTSVERAIAFYKAKGLEFDESSATFDDEGKCKFIYFKEQIGGFAVHLVNKK